MHAQYEHSPPNELPLDERDAQTALRERAGGNHERSLPRVVGAVALTASQRFFSMDAGLRACDASIRRRVAATSTSPAPYTSAPEGSGTADTLDCTKTWKGGAASGGKTPAGNKRSVTSWSCPVSPTQGRTSQLSNRPESEPNWMRVMGPVGVLMGSFSTVSLASVKPVGLPSVRVTVVSGPVNNAKSKLALDTSGVPPVPSGITMNAGFPLMSLITFPLASVILRMSDAQPEPAAQGDACAIPADRSATTVANTESRRYFMSVLERRR